MSRSGRPGFFSEGISPNRFERPGEALDRLPQTAQLEAEILERENATASPNAQIQSGRAHNTFDVDGDTEAEGKEGYNLPSIPLE